MALQAILAYSTDIHSVEPAVPTHVITSGVEEAGASYQSVGMCRSEQLLPSSSQLTLCAPDPGNLGTLEALATKCQARLLSVKPVLLVGNERGWEGERWPS